MLKLLYASFKILLEKSEVNKIDNIFLAGAFGSQISPERALIIGLVPDAKVVKLLQVGIPQTPDDYSSFGCSSRKEISSIVKKVCK